MTDNEIIKDLQCASEWFAEHGRNTNTAIIGICDRALDLINRLQAEKEALINGQKTLQKYIAEQKSEILILNHSNANLMELYYNEKEKVASAKQKVIDACKMLENAKAEAIKEFAERLKKNSIAVDVSFGYGREHYAEAVTVIAIDSIVKGMVGEGEANFSPEDADA